MDETEKEGKEILEIPSLMLIGFEPEILECCEQNRDWDQ